MKVYLHTSGTYSEYTVEGVYLSWRKALEILVDEKHAIYERICNPPTFWLDKIKDPQYRKYARELLDAAKHAKELGYFAYWKENKTKDRYHRHELHNHIQAFEVIE